MELTPNSPATNHGLGGPDRALSLGWTPLFSLQPHGVVLVDRSGLCLEANPAAAQILGLGRGQLIATALNDVLGEVVVDSGMQVSQRVLARTQAHGGIHWLELSAQPGPEESVLVVFQDITETHNQKVNLERMTRLYAALSQVNQAIVWSPTQEALFNKICEVMVEFGKFSMAWIGWNDPLTHEVGVASAYGDQTGYLVGLRIRSDDTLLGRGATGSAIRTGHPSVINDFLGSPDSQPWHQAAINSRFAASASFPISIGGEVVGALTVFAPEKDMFGQHEIALLVEAAGDISFALDHLALDVRRREAEEALRDSRARLQKAEMVASFGNWELSLTDGTMSASEGAYQIYGLQQHAMALSEIQALALPEYRHALDASLKALLEQCQPYNVEYRIRRAGDGELRCIHSVAEYDAERKTVFGVINDITERKQIEDALKESEFFFRESQRAASIGSYRADFVSGFWTSSDVLDAIFGIDGSYVRSIQGWVELIHPEDRGMMELYLQANVIAAHQPFAKQYRIIRPSDGEVRWVQGLGEGSFNDDGVFLALVGTIHDITDLKQAEQSLIDTNQRMHLATDSAGQGIWDWDLLAGTMTWDDRMFALYGASREEIQGTVQDWKDGLHPEDLERAIAECEAALRGEAPFNTEFRVRHRDGSILWIKALAQVLRDSSGVPVRMIGINQDITEQKKVEAQLQRAQKMESLGNLASGIAHDMNNVLGAILGLSSAELINFTPNQPIYRTLNIIREAATRGGGVVRSLLTLARPSPKERRVVNLNELLLEEARLLERTTLSKVRLELDLIPDLQPILGDAAELSHVIMNLCINAVDAMGERGTLTLRTRNVSEAHVEVTVEDSGCGMPTDVLAKAMDPFFTTKEAGKGTGLGLAMVFATVKAHGGEVTLRSEVGQGTMVSLRFPTIATKDLVAEPPVSNQSCVGTATLAVLLVDDDDLMQASTRMLLEALGHAVTSASSGEEALSLLDQGLRPEAVILDMNMPGLGGKGTLPRLRDSCPTVPVFLATGRADDEAMDLAAAHPFVTLLPKPFGFEELQGHLQQISPQA